MTVLFPPVLESQGPAFLYATSNLRSTFFEIRFQLPALVSKNDIKHIQVSIKYAGSGEPAVNEKYAPDRQTLFISADASVYFQEEDTGNYVVRIPYDCFGSGLPMKDTTYMVQVRFGSTGLWMAGITGLETNGNFGNFAAWRKNATTSVPSLFGEWSNIQRVYCYTSATHNIGYNFNDFVPQVYWVYSPQGDDPIEQVKIVYKYEGFQGEIVNSEVFSGQYNNDNVFTLKANLKVAPVTPILVSLEAVTKNNTVYGDMITIPSVLGNHGLLSVAPGGGISDAILMPEEQEDGVIAKQIRIPNGMPQSWFYNVYRIDTLSLECIKIINEQQILLGEDLIFKDYTVEMGIDYQYTVAVVNNGIVQQLLNDLYPFGKDNPGYARLGKMEATFLTSRGHQLRLQGDVNITGFKRNTQDAFQTTIGGIYPFYSRSSRMNYRSFTLNALVSINFDPTSTFMRLDAFGKLKMYDIIDEDKYQMLISASPGLEKYFQPQGSDPKTKRPNYQLIGAPKDFKDPLSQEEILALVNRCTSTLVLNGLWWDTDDGNSSLIIQDRDIIATEEFSLSRRRVQDAINHANEKLIELGQEENSPQLSLEGQVNQVRGPKSAYDNYLHRQSGLTYGTTPTDSLVFSERKFREKVMEWLSDGTPKLFRSETEGNMIVIISNAQFTPQKNSSRMVYSFSATVTEIAEYSAENLINYNLVPTYIKSVYNGNSIYDYIWGQPDQNVANVLSYIYNVAWNIPNMMIDNEATSIWIPTLSGVKNAIGELRFTAQDLPNGIQIDPITGVIFGYPKNISETMSPGKAVLKVKDLTTGQEASCIIGYGYIYTKLTYMDPIFITPNEGKSFVVGEPIPRISVMPTAVVSGGVQSYTFYGSNLPDGIMVDNETGLISGAFSTEMIPDETDKEIPPEIIGKIKSEVIVMDQMGQQIIIPVYFSYSVYPLSFIHLDEFDYGYTEIAKEIPIVDLTKGVSGGEPPYTFSFVPNTPHPAKWECSPDGKIWKNLSSSETEVSTLSPNTFEIQVTDAKSTVRSISIYYDRILETFKFTWQPEFDILYNENTKAPETSLKIGTVVQGVDVSLGVSGGLPFSDEKYPYRFDSADLWPNYRITAAGKIVGQALTAQPRKFAHIYAYDARGERVEMVGNKYNTSPTAEPLTYGVTLSEIATNLKFLGTGFHLKGLRQGKNLASGNLYKILEDGTEVLRNDLMISQADFYYNGKEEQCKLSLSSGEWNGINVIEGRNAGNVCWYFTGAPKNGADATRLILTISSPNGDEKVNVPVIIDPIIADMNWTGAIPPVEAPVGSSVTITFTGISGGKGPYRMKWKDPSTVPDWLKANPFVPTPADGSSTSNWSLKIDFPEDSGVDGGDFVIVIEDLSDTSNSTENTLIIKKNSVPLVCTIINNPLNQKVLMKGVSIIPESQRLILTASGGDSPYTFYYKGTLPAGLTLETVQINGVYYGKISNTVPELNNDVANIGHNFYVEDLYGNRAYVEGPTQVWNPPQVVEPPKRGEETINWRETTQTIGGVAVPVHECDFIIGALKIGVSYETKALFQNIAYPNLEPDTYSKNMPRGFSLVKKDSGFYVNGTTMEEMDELVVIIDLYVMESEYNQLEIFRCNVKFSGIAGALRWTYDNSAFIPGAGVDVEIEFDLGTLTGGIGPFNWFSENKPAGFNIYIDPDGRHAILKGSFSAKVGKGSITITVEDQGTDPFTVLNRSITYNGAYDPLKIVVNTPIVIPDVAAREAIPNIDVNDFVTITGGEGSISFKDKDNKLSGRGYVLSGAGIFNGTSGDMSFNGEDANFYIEDSVGQSVPFMVHLGKITGSLTINNDIAPHLPGGIKNTNIPLPEQTVDFTNAIVGYGAETAKLSWQNGDNIWKSNGGVAEITGDKIIKVTKLPNLAMPSGKIPVIITSGEQQIFTDVIYDEVTEPPPPEPPVP